MSKVIAQDDGDMLVSMDMPSPGKGQRFSPFFRSGAHPLNPKPVLESRLFMPRMASITNGNASLGTAVVAMSRIGQKAYDVEPLAEQIEKIGGANMQPYRLLLDSLRHASQELEFPHGIRILGDCNFQAPRPGKDDNFHFLVMEPFGALLSRLTSGALHRTALKVRLLDPKHRQAGFFGFAVHGIPCEDKDDALTLAYSFEAHNVEFELY